MSTNQSYLQKYSKRNSKQKHFNSLSVNKIISNQSESQNKIGTIISKLEDRLDGVQVKMISLTNVVKLLQKYTQTKDQQYEREKQNLAFRQMNIKIPHSDSALPNKLCMQFEGKVKQFQQLSKKLKDQLTVVQSLKVQIARQNSQKLLQTQAKTCTLPISGVKSMDQYDMPDIIQELQDRIRDQLNRKIQICMNIFKSLTHSENTQNSSLNRVMLQQQIHNLTLTINKLENQNVRNIQLIENRVDEIVNHIKKIHAQGPIQNPVSSFSFKPQKEKIMNKQSRSRSKSQPKRDKQTSCIVQRNKIKQQQLRQAIKKKKQITEKLKMK